MTVSRRRFLGGLAATGAAMLAGCATTSGERGIRGLNVKTIDTHAHWHAPEFVALLEKEGAANGAKISRDARGQLNFNFPGYTTVFQATYMDLGIRLKEMDASGVDIHVLSLTSPMVYWAPPAFGLKLAQVYNDSLATAHTQYPNRFYGMLTLPMQAPDLALTELERAAKLPGIRGVYMATHVMGKNLDEKAFWPIYERSEALGFPIFLHPIDPVGADRMRRYYLRNFLGNPYDTGIAASSLMFGGVMDAFPKLEVMLPHAGGTFPSLIGRMTHGSAVRPETKHMTKPPVAYLRRFYYDTISHNEQIMLNIIRQVGADRVVMGSDHPADMSTERPVDFVERIPDLSTYERELILGGNAARLLKI
jgi:aminocarboxymuconate-semialdehyde decarboxylase